MARILARGELDDGEEMYLDALSDLIASYDPYRHYNGHDAAVRLIELRE